MKRKGGVLLSLLLAQAAANAGPAPLLSNVRTWMYLLQGVEEPASVQKLVESPYDLIVLEPTFTLQDEEKFPIAAVTAELHASRSGRVVLAYVDIGEIEKYRTYWKNIWVPPTDKQAGSPSFILNADPDGWNDSYVAAYWDPHWQALMLDQAAMLMHAGFDGLYLDWVDGYEDPSVIAAAKRAGIDPARAMVDFIGLLRERIRSINPRAVIIGQNADYLPETDPNYFKVIDAAAFEDTWFRGKANADWNSPKGGDIPNHYRGEDGTAERVEHYKVYLAAGKPVLTIDYSLQSEHAAQVYRDSQQSGLIPLVSRVSLSRITTTPPPWLGAASAHSTPLPNPR